MRELCFTTVVLKFQKDQNHVETCQHTDCWSPSPPKVSDYVDSRVGSEVVFQTGFRVVLLIQAQDPHLKRKGFALKGE